MKQLDPINILMRGIRNQSEAQNAAMVAFDFAENHSNRKPNDPVGYTVAGQTWAAHRTKGGQISVWPTRSEQ